MIRIAVLLTLAALTCRGQALESWNTVEAKVSEHGKADLAIHTQLRLKLHAHEITQGRVGPIVHYAWKPRLGLVAGYYYRQLDYQGAWADSHRFFAGAQSILREGTLGVSSRTVVERHFGGPAPNQVQFRQLWRLTWNRRVSPIASTETLCDQHGFTDQRVTGGANWRMGERFVYELNYLYSFRVARSGGKRQAITFTVRFDMPHHIF